MSDNDLDWKDVIDFFRKGVYAELDKLIDNAEDNAKFRGGSEGQCWGHSADAIRAAKNELMKDGTLEDNRFRNFLSWKDVSQSVKNDLYIELDDLIENELENGAEGQAFEYAADILSAAKRKLMEND